MIFDTYILCIGLAVGMWHWYSFWSSHHHIPSPKYHSNRTGAVLPCLMVRPPAVHLHCHIHHLTLLFVCSITMCLLCGHILSWLPLQIRKTSRECIQLCSVECWHSRSLVSFPAHPTLSACMVYMSLGVPASGNSTIVPEVWHLSLLQFILVMVQYTHSESLQCSQVVCRQQWSLESPTHCHKEFSTLHWSRSATTLVQVRLGQECIALHPHPCMQP